jgi:hypothetical protein
VKLIRLTDDRYILDAGTDIVPEQMEQLNSYFSAWWATHAEHPMTVVIGGIETPLEYEDRRTSDLEGRVKRLEDRIDDAEAEARFLKPIGPGR